MTNKKITDLVELTTPTTDDVFPLVDIATNSTKKAQLANIPISTATQTALDAKQATLVSGTNIKTINSTSLLGSGNIDVVASPAGTAGQIQFSDGSAFAADSNLYWDNTNKRLGVGTASPTASIHNTGTTLLTQVFGSSPTLQAYNGRTAYDSTLRISNQGGGDMYFGGVGLLITGNTGMGISTATPTARLQVKGSGSTSATTSLLVQNSSGTELLKVKDDGATTIGQQLSTYPNVSFGSIYGGVFLNGSSQIALRIGGTDALKIDGSGYVGLGVSSQNASARLQIDSTTQGFLPPRMTTTQKNAISTPAAGLMVYDTDTNKLCCYNGTTWNDLF